MALPKVHRLRHRQDFKAVYQRGLRRGGRCLTLRALNSSSGKSLATRSSADQASLSKGPESWAKPAQIGFSISQKVSKRAVVRNRIRRRLSAAMQALLPHIPMGWKVVIVVRPEATQCDYHQFLQELKQLLADAEVINGC